MKNQQQQQQQRQQQDQETMGLFDSTKNPNLETNHHSSNITLTAEEQYAMPPSPPPPPPPPQHFKTTHHQKDIHVPNKINKNHEVIKKLNSLSCTCSPAAQEVPPEAKVEEEEESGRERLKRHRAEMAGRVRIPDIWGHEDLLKDWIDCTVFDSSLGNNTIMSARAALVQQRTSNLRINAS